MRSVSGIAQTQAARASPLRSGRRRLGIAGLRQVRGKLGRRQLDDAVTLAIPGRDQPPRICEPTQRPLAALPLKIVDGKLVVAMAFTGRVGIVPT